MPEPTELLLSTGRKLVSSIKVTAPPQGSSVYHIEAYSADNEFRAAIAFERPKGCALSIYLEDGEVWALVTRIPEPEA